MRGKRIGENKCGPEWKVEHVAFGADPDDWEFYPPQDIPQTVPEGEDTQAALDAFFTQPRRRG